MPTNTYTPIGSVTLATSVTEVTFTVPSGYRDLILVCDWAGSASANYLYVRLNGDSGANYSFVSAYGYTSTSTGSSVATSQTGLYTGVSRTSRSFASLQILDVSATDKHKTALARHGISDMSEVQMTASRWANTAAVTSLTLVIGGNTFSSGSTFNLFGIVA